MKSPINNFHSFKVDIYSINSIFEYKVLFNCGDHTHTCLS